MPAKTNAQRQREWRERRKAELARLRKLEAKLNGERPKPSLKPKGGSRDPKYAVIWQSSGVPDKLLCVCQSETRFKKAGFSITRLFSASLTGPRIVIT
jgi:hypothetical protein